jgi:hypothetical protein
VKRRRYYIAILAAIILAAVSTACRANTTDQYIEDLKSTNPETRAQAAYELGCS